MVRQSILLLASLLAGCSATPSQMNKLQLGMTKSEVVSVMGTPNSTSARANVEVLRYERGSVPNPTPPPYFRPDEYYVRIVDGRVESYGRSSEVSIAP